MNDVAGVAVHDTDDALYRGSTRPEVRALLPKLKPGLNVLEVGCGEGAFSAAIPGAKEIWGIEPHQASAEIANQKLHKVIVDTFDGAKSSLPAGYFDLVICNDVIEHMTDHDGFLRCIQSYMAPGAILVGSVPNVRFYGNLFNLVVARDWHYKPSGVLDRTHFRFFTFRSLRRSLEEAAFHVEHLQGLNKGRRVGWSVRGVAEILFRDGLIFLSGGMARDIRFLQIGFVAVTRRQ